MHHTKPIGTLLNFKIYYKPTVVKALWHWDKWISERNCPEINPYMYSQLTFGKGVKSIQCGRPCLFTLQPSPT